MIRRRAVPGGEHALPATLHPVLRDILLARGVREAEALDLSLARMAPMKGLSGLDAAANRLADAIQSGQRIMVVGDFDADGATGTAVAVRALRAMGAAGVEFRVPNRFEFGYGLSTGLVDTLAESPPDVLLTVDSGICCHDGITRAAELGIDVIVTDHHLPGESLPPAFAIVNPNLSGDDFPSKALAGVGVVFYLAGALRARLRDSGWFGARRPEPNLGMLLDLVALGTVADVVPLDRNNRVLVEQGLRRIRAGQASPGVMALLRAGKRDYRNVSASDLGFAVGPRLNAAGRLEDMAVGIRCLLADDVEEARELAATLDGLNEQRRAMQATMQDSASAQVSAIIEQLGDEVPFSLCLHDPEWHQGIVGLVASRVKEATHRPVVAFAPEEEGSARLKGSARSIKGLHVRDVLAHVDARQPGLIDAFGGHAMAAGLSIAANRLDDFRAAFEASTRLFLADEPPRAERVTDGELAAADLNLDFARELHAMGPWGQRFPEPLFEGAFEVLDQRVVGGAHLKMVLRPLDGHEVIDAIAFGTLPEDLDDARRARFLYRLDVNHFRGQASAQLVIEHIVR
ncbi:single-stranded-DNA-specific exonuclease RecJ [Marinihelvus fidelis]|uniref:Single-stranded-DNA-specific exonuclease RecJ n=1 Tax=Marinihelvus fidelis TaxID=2613842 RepID=A0A5N0TIT2_9GAMM|nr:single-stranded-DNA-specific exonuclease RecJ [Marinihelvus fidelis]KAA9133199.1 single-stranded-DNA-specific exonuclease RecJ [Marinihelvus fidelis]